MAQPQQPNEEQVRYWNEDAGPRWVALQEGIDAMLAPFGAATLEALAPREGERIVDVGAGCGATTLELARRVRSTGRVLAVDVSAPMLRRAAERAREAGLANIDFLVADVQAAPPGGPHDAAFSRFGTMFFDDPVLAFQRLRESVAPSGRLASCAWRSREENDWLAGPLRVAARFVEIPVNPDPHAPGPFGLFDAQRTRSLLEDAGWSEVSLEPFDADVRIGGASTPEEAAAFLLKLAPLDAALAEAGEPARQRILDAFQEFFAPHASGGRVVMPGRAWILTARA